MVKNRIRFGARYLRINTAVSSFGCQLDLLGFFHILQTTRRYIKSAATRKATEAQGLKLARQLAVIRERARTGREALEVG